MNQNFAAADNRSPNNHFAKTFACSAFFSLGIVVLSQGCAPNQDVNAQRLVGKWQLMTSHEIEQSQASVDEKLAKKMGRDSARIDEAVRGEDLMIVEFLHGAVLKTKAIQEKQGSWVFKSWSEEDRVLTLETKLGAEDSQETKVRFVSDDIISMIPPNISVLKKTLMFRRTK